MACHGPLWGFLGSQERTANSALRRNYHWLGEMVIRSALPRVRFIRFVMPCHDLSSGVMGCCGVPIVGERKADLSGNYGLLRAWSGYAMRSFDVRGLALDLLAPKVPLPPAARFILGQLPEPSVKLPE